LWAYAVHLTKSAGAAGVDSMYLPEGKKSSYLLI